MDSSEAYKVRAQGFLRGREPSPINSQVVDQWARILRQGATVIELACGGGYAVNHLFPC
jgi:hypothetical protein